MALRAGICHRRIMTRPASAFRRALTATALCLGLVAVGAYVVTLPSASGASPYTLDQRLTKGTTSAGNGAFNATASDSAIVPGQSVSSDGGVVIFTSSEPLVAGDTAGDTELFERADGVTRQLTSLTDTEPFGSARVLPNGFVLFLSPEELVGATDGGLDDYFLVDRSGGIESISGAFAGSASDAVVSGDGDTIAFDIGGQIKVMHVQTNLVTPADTGTVRGISRDGSRIFFESTQTDTTGPDDAGKLDVFSMKADGTGKKELSNIAPPSGAQSAWTYFSSSPDGNTVALSTAQNVSSDLNTATDLYSVRNNDPAQMEWATKPGPGAPGSSPAGPSLTGGTACDGGAVLFNTDEGLVAGDNTISPDVYRHPAGAATTPQLLTGHNAAPTLVSASDDCSKAVVSTADQLGGLGDGNATNDLFLVTGTTPSLIANDSTSPFVTGTNLGHLVFSSAKQLTGDDIDASKDSYLWSAADNSRTLITTPTGGTAKDQTAVDVTDDGRYVVDETAQALGDGDTDTVTDLYLIKRLDPTGGGSSSGSSSSTTKPTANPMPLGTLAGPFVPRVLKRRRSFMLATGLVASCPVGPCRAAVTASGKKGKKKISLGSYSVDVRPGATVPVTVKLTTRAARTLRKAKRLRVTIAVTLTPTQAKTITKTKTVTLKAPK